jgi:hypothetical protein
MKAVNDIWRQLVGRRLLPVAAILVVALAAVPLALGKDAAEPESPNLQPVDETAAAATKTIVSVAQPAGAHRRVSGKAVNPFLGQKLPKQKKEASTTADEPDRGATADAPSGGDGSVTPSPAPATPIAPVAPPTGGTSKPHYDRFDLSIRFGDSESDSLERKTLGLLEPLPSQADAVVAYIGVSKDGKSAKFLLDDGVVANGDGVCRGGTGQCETVSLRAGETEFFDVVDELGNVTASYELDLIKIHRAGGGSSSPARTASVKAVRATVASTQSLGFATGR